MSLDTLQLSHFRNFDQASVQFSSRLTLLIGDNGQGKTNLLEAVYLLMQGRDFRTSQEREAIQQGAESALLTGSGQFLGRAERWRHSIPGSGRRSHQGLIQPLVLFSPDDVYLAKGSPERRRRFLDLLLSAHDSRYARALRAYNRVLLQRNRALKEATYQKLVDDFTPLLIREGLYLWRRRQETVMALVPEAKKIMEEIAPGEDLSVSLHYGGAPAPIDTAEAYQAAVENRRRDEQIRLTTLVGPHRDDLMMTLGGMATTVYASQGQLRSVALTLKLATMHWLLLETGIRPIILLDDVLSELDYRRRQKVLETVSQPGQQTIVTDTEPRSYAALDPSILQVATGEVQSWPKRPTPGSPPS
ncbi:MAG: DNA replication and repair protein RecF [Thermaerobacter sp.]|nr:DNA replication and repair protein RecF [Thermaerobacter sp.]